MSNPIESINAILNLAWKISDQATVNSLNLDATTLQIDWEEQKVYLTDGTTKVEIPDYETLLLQVRYSGISEDFYFG